MVRSSLCPVLCNLLHAESLICMEFRLTGEGIVGEPHQTILLGSGRENLGSPVPGGGNVCTWVSDQYGSNVEDLLTNKMSNISFW